MLGHCTLVVSCSHQGEKECGERTHHHSSPSETGSDDLNTTRMASLVQPNTNRPDPILLYPGSCINAPASSTELSVPATLPPRLVTSC